jgi:lysophospholipase L1-like esterase
MSIVTRVGKGSKLTIEEMDNNLLSLETDISGNVSSITSKLDKGSYTGSAKDLENAIAANVTLIASKLDKGSYIGTAKDLENAIISAVTGASGISIIPTSPAPSGTGIASFTATQAGTYTNYGGVVVAANSFAIISRSAAGVFSISQTPLNLTSYAKLTDIIPIINKNYDDFIKSSGKVKSIKSEYSTSTINGRIVGITQDFTSPNVIIKDVSVSFLTAVNDAYVVVLDTTTGNLTDDFNYKVIDIFYFSAIVGINTVFIGKSYNASTTFGIGSLVNSVSLKGSLDVNKQRYFRNANGSTVTPVLNGDINMLSLANATGIGYEINLIESFKVVPLPEDLGKPTYYSINKLLPETIINGFQISNGATSIVADSDSIIAKIPIRDYNQWYINRPTGTGLTTVNFFAKNDAYISYINFTSPSNFFNPPSNADYLIINLKWNGGTDVTLSTMIAVSNIALDYQTPSIVGVEQINGFPISANKLTNYDSVKEGIIKDYSGTNINKNFGLTEKDPFHWYGNSYANVLPTTNKFLINKGILNVVKSGSNFYYKIRTENTDFRNKYVQGIVYILSTPEEIVQWAFKFYCSDSDGSNFTGLVNATKVVTEVETGLYKVIFSAKIAATASVVKPVLWIGGGVISSVTNYVGGFFAASADYDLSNIEYVKNFDTIDLNNKIDISNNRIQNLEFNYNNNTSKFLEGKKFNMLGDSITYGFAVSTTTTYAYLLATKNSMDYVSYGISGTPLSGTATNAMVNRFGDMRNDVDIVGVYGGTNDSPTSNLGTITDDTNATFYGSLNVLCNGLLTKYPTARIFFMAPERFSTSTDALLLNKAITEVCALYAIPVLDLAKEGGIYSGGNAAQFSAFHVDTKHPNEAGHARMSRVLESFLKRIAS